MTDLQSVAATDIWSVKELTSAETQQPHHEAW